MALFVASGGIAAGLQAILGFSDRTMMIGLVGTFLAMAALVFAHVLRPGGGVSVSQGQLRVERRFRPSLALPLGEIEFEPAVWTAQGVRIGDHLAAGMQLLVRAGSRSISFGASGNEVARRAAEADVPVARTAPQIALSEGDFIELLEVLWTS